MFYNGSKTEERHNGFAIASVGANRGCDFPEVPKTESINKAAISGYYSCDAPEKISGSGTFPRAPIPAAISICEKEGEATMAVRDPFLGIWMGKKIDGYTNDYFKLEAISVTKLEAYTTTGIMMDKQSLEISETTKGLDGETLHRTSCKREYLCNGNRPENDKYNRLVFIRPCPGQLYRSENGGFKKDGKKLITKAGGKTTWEVCRDLKVAGVTSVMLAFKVDQENSGCGESGQLLYQSKKYPENISPGFKKAQSEGIDPIGAILENPDCEGLKFHAWFPVFFDRYAAGKFGGQKAYVKREKIDDLVSEAASDLIKKDKHDCESDRYAEPSNQKVVKYELEILKEIEKTYPKLIGINLDYIRYAGDQNTTCKPAKGEKEATTKNVKDSWIVKRGQLNLL